MGMKIRKMAVRGMRQKPLQFSGAVFLLAIAVMLFVMLSSSMALMDSSNQLFRKDYKQEDFQFTTGESLTKGQIGDLENKFKLDLEERSWLDAEWKEGTTVRFLSLQSSMNLPYVVDGTLPDEKNEAALTVAYANHHSLEVGEKWKAGGKTYTVTAHVHLPDYIYGVQNENDLFYDSKTFGAALIRKADFPENRQAPVYYTGLFKKEEQQTTELKKAVSAVVPVTKWTDAEDNIRISYIDAEIESNQSFGTVLPLFIGLLSLFIVVLIVKRQIELQAKQIGTLLALGYTAREITSSFMVYPLAVSSAGSAAGMVIGLLASKPMTSLYTSFYNLPILKSFAFDPYTLVLGFAVPVIVIGAAGFFTIRKTVMKPPLQLLNTRPAFSKKGTVSLSKRLSFKARFRLKMLIGNPSKSFVLFIGILFSAILLTFGFISMNSMNQLLKKTYEDAYRYEYAVYYQDLKTNEMTGGDSPFTVSEVTLKSGDKKDAKTQLYGIDADTSMLKLIDSRGADLNQSLSDGAVVTQALAAAEGLQKGDSVTIRNQWTEKEKSVKITGIAEIFIGHAIYLSREEVNSFLDLENKAYLGKWTNEKPEENRNEPITMIEDKQAMKKVFETLLEPTKYSVAVISLFAFIIGLIIIYLITSLIMEENTVNISLLKVMGYEQKEISSVLLNVYTPIVIIGYILGIPLAFISYKGLMASVSESTSFSLPIEAEPVMLIAGFVIVYLAYWTSLQLSKRKIRNISLQEVLKRQE